MKISKITLLFTVVMLGSAFLSWRIAQGKFFGEIVSDRVAEVVREKLGSEIGFDRVGIVLLPPGIFLENVNYEVPVPVSPFKTLVGSSKKMYLSFDVIDFVFGKPSLSKLQLEDSEVAVELIDGKSFSEIDWAQVFPNNKKKTDDSSFKLEEIFNSISSINNISPIHVKSLSVDQLQVVNAGNAHIINSFDIILSKKNIEVAGDLRGLPLIKYGESLVKAIDQIRFDIELTKKAINIDQLNIYRGWSELELTGEIGEDLNKKIIIQQVDGVIREDLGNFIFSDKNIPASGLGGLVQANFSLIGNEEGISGKFRLLGNKVVSSYINFDNVDLKGVISNHVITIDSLSAKIDNGEVSLVSPVSFFNIKDNVFKINQANIKFKEIRSKAILKYIDDILAPLDAVFSGAVSVYVDKNEIKVKSLEQLALNSLFLRFGNNTPILDTKNLKIQDFDLNATFSKPSFVSISGILLGEKTRMKISGNIDKGVASFIGETGVVDFSEVGKISGVSLGGTGEADLKIFGDVNNLNIDFGGRFNSFSIFDMYSGTTDAKVNFSTGSKTLKVLNFSGTLPSGKIEGQGQMNLAIENGLDIGLKFSDVSFEDGRKVFAPLIISVPHKESLKGSFSGDVSLNGSPSITGLDVKGQLNCNPSQFNEITFEHCKAGLRFVNNKFEFDLESLKKSSGQLKGKFQYNLSEEKSNYSFNWKGFRLKDFENEIWIPSGLNAFISGDISGEGLKGKMSSRGNFYATRAQIGSQRLGNSFFQIKDDGAVFISRGFIFDNWIQISQKIDLAHTQLGQENSHIDLKFKVNEMKKLWGLISPHNLNDSSLEGQFEANLLANYNANKPEVASGKFSIEKFSFSRGEDNLSLQKPIAITFQKGLLAKNVLEFVGEKSKLDIALSGQLFDGIKISSKGNLNLALLELLHSKIVRSRGNVKINVDSNGQFGDLKHQGDLKMDHFSLNLEGVPGSFENISGTAQMEGKYIVISSLVGKFGEGGLDGFGRLELTSFPPSINLNFGLNSSRINLFEHSFAVISGRGNFFGNGFPYTLNGSFFAENTEILEEFDSFAKDRKIEQAFTRFRPVVVSQTTKEQMLFDVKFSSDQGIKLKNSMAQVEFGGSGALVGGANAPKLDGHFVVVPQRSKFYFRGNDFLITQGHIHFFGKESQVNPELSFIGESSISNYKVTMKVEGRAKNFELTLKSDPPLNQRDIVSLLAVGYTGSTSEELNESDRGDIGSAGLGSLLLDKFQFNEGLSSNFGLKVMVAPEVSANEENAIKSRVGSEGTTDAGMYKSATKVTVKRDLGKSIDMSVSSTVGGSLGQKQEMNINYKVGKNVSLQMIYEVEEQGVEDKVGQSTSAGADLKFRWTFK